MLVVVVVALLLVTNVVTALAVYYLAPAAPAATVQPLRVIGPWSGPEKDKFLPVLNLFKNTTGINYEYITTRQEDLQSLLPNWFAARRAPADLIFMPSSFVKTYGTQGHAADLAGTVSESNYAAGALDPLKDGSKIYGGAYTGKVKPGFWYRESFFAAHNYQVPTTWTGFEALLRQIETDGSVNNTPIISGDGVGWPLSDVVEHFLATYGGPNMNKQIMAKTLPWTSTSVHDVFANYLVRTLTPGVVCVASCWSAPRQWDTGVAEWWKGDYALYFMGSWITGMVTPNSDIRVMPLPGGVNPSGVVFAADYFFVPTYASRIDDAKRLAAFLGSSAAQQLQVTVGGHIATVTGVPLSAYPAVDARIAANLTGKVILSDLDDTIGGTFQGTFWTQLQALWANPANLDAVLANIQAAVMIRQ